MTDMERYQIERYLKNHFLLRESACHTVITRLAPFPVHLRPFIPYAEKPWGIKNEFTYENPPASSPHAIHVPTIRGWLNACDETHGRHCRQSLDAEGYRPQWLIDVKRSCLVPCKEEYRYVALSYIWGKNEEASVSATVETISSLQGEGSLLKLNIPRTILDTIHLVSLLGQQYLWVDRLCIVQDDAATKQVAINGMINIYASSYVTIIAAQGTDASCSLWNGELSSSEATISRFEAPNSSREDDHWNRLHYWIMHEQSRSLLRTKWWSRGWTFQEYVFSRRRILFHNNTVNWDCQCAAWHENCSVSLYPSSQCALQRGASPVGSNVMISPWPDLNQYARMVALFNSRDLTFPEDVINAFAGVVNCFGLVFKGGFITGLPQMFFHASLLWQPHDPLERRRPIRPGSDGTAFPSWSWVGWQGNLTSESWRAGCDYMRIKGDYLDRPSVSTIIDRIMGIHGASRKETEWENTAWTTQPTVEWTYSKSLDSPRIPVMALSAERRSAANSVDPLPDGWRSHTCPKTSKTYFTHDCDPGQEFWYPVPVQTPSSRCETSPILAPFLQTRTRAAILQITKIIKTQLEKDLEKRQDRQEPSAYAGPTCASAILSDTEGNWAGCLRLNEQSIAAQDRIGRTCLLIELSRGSIESRQKYFGPEDEIAMAFDEWFEDECPRHRGPYQFYNVMWIEERDGVAYRKAVGRVEKTVWEGVAVVTWDIILN